jgi:hypothetical protein
MSTLRWDETWHRLREWTNGQGPSERLAAQLLSAEGFEGIDPSHPLGGRDGRQDAVCTKDSKRWTMAVYFPRGEEGFGEIEKKFSHDSKGARSNGADGIAFVTNQELRLSERSRLIQSALPLLVELFHLERLTAILDRPGMMAVRKQFLNIDDDSSGPIVIELGGSGGQGMGAGGGGGGAFGGRATGGAGGQGGDIHLAGKPGEAPGAGGGGAGAVGEAAVGGEGGGGGEVRFGVFLAEDLPTTIEIKVGAGGQALPGADGQDGEGSSFGDLLVAKGGKGGRAGKPGLLGRQATARDLSAGLGVCGIYLAECCHIRQGMLDLLSAGWEWWNAPPLPTNTQWPVAFTVSMGCIEPGESLIVFVIVKDPSGIERLREGVSLPRGPISPTAFRHGIVALQFPIDNTGVWSVTIESGAHILTALPIEVRCLPLSDTVPSRAG